MMIFYCKSTSFEVEWQISIGCILRIAGLKVNVLGSIRAWPMRLFWADTNVFHCRYWYLCITQTTFGRH